jgi:hypothetical protein
MTHERLDRRLDEAEEREAKRAAWLARELADLHPRTVDARLSEASRREARARRAGFGSYAEEERHSR